MSLPNSGSMPVGCRVPEAEGRGVRIGIVSILRQAIAYPSSSSLLVSFYCKTSQNILIDSSAQVSTESTSSPQDMLSFQLEGP